MCLELNLGIEESSDAISAGSSGKAIYILHPFLGPMLCEKIKYAK